MLFQLGCFDGTHLALSLRLGRGRLDDACLAGGHLRAVGDRIGAVSIYSSLEGLLGLDSLSFGSLKKDTFTMRIQYGTVEYLQFLCYLFKELVPYKKNT